MLSQPLDKLQHDSFPYAEGYCVGYIAQVGLESSGDVDDPQPPLKSSNVTVLLLY